jgi:DNA topoisomerase-3
MSNAGAEDMPDDAERKGLGTPATRAGIIEKIIKNGFVERQKKNLVPTDKGINLISILPEILTSPKLTAEWEHQLKQVERGETTNAAFLSAIADMTKKLVYDNNRIKPKNTEKRGK